METLTKEEAIKKVEQGFGSIYSKEDVLSLINSIKETSEHVDHYEYSTRDRMKFLSVMQEDIIRSVTDAISSNSDVIDSDSATFYLEYDNRVMLEDITYNSYELDSSVDAGIRSLQNELECQLAKEEEQAREAEKQVEELLELEKTTNE